MSCVTLFKENKPNCVFFFTFFSPFILCDLWLFFNVLPLLVVKLTEQWIWCCLVNKWLFIVLSFSCGFNWWLLAHLVEHLLHRPWVRVWFVGLCCMSSSLSFLSASHCPFQNKRKIPAKHIEEKKKKDDAKLRAYSVEKKKFCWCHSYNRVFVFLQVCKFATIADFTQH